jgi:hypothetical protein
MIGYLLGFPSIVNKSLTYRITTTSNGTFTVGHDTGTFTFWYKVTENTVDSDKANIEITVIDGQ